MIQYQEINTKEDYLRWQSFYKFRERLIREVMMKQFNVVTNQNQK